MLRDLFVGAHVTLQREVEKFVDVCVRVIKRVFFSRFYCLAGSSAKQ